MERLKGLGRWQKGVLLFMIAMIAVFTVLYPITIAREGFAYKDTILVPNSENGTTVYSGKIWGKQVRFTVSQDKTVYFQYGDKTYGPYTVREDPSAVPKDKQFGENMVGVEIRRGEEILFRGGIAQYEDFRHFYSEDGSTEDIGITFTTNDGSVLDEFGNRVDPMEPSVSTILDLTGDPELTHKGQWITWFGAVAICILNALSILFAEELFHWNLKFQIRNADRAEPSDWEIAGRYISWTGLPILALILFIIGLR